MFKPFIDFMAGLERAARAMRKFKTAIIESSQPGRPSLWHRRGHKGQKAAEVRRRRVLNAMANESRRINRCL